MHCKVLVILLRSHQNDESDCLSPVRAQPSHCLHSSEDIFCHSETLMADLPCQTLSEQRRSWVTTIKNLPRFSLSAASCIFKALNSTTIGCVSVELRITWLVLHVVKSSIHNAYGTTLAMSDCKVDVAGRDNFLNIKWNMNMSVFCCCCFCFLFTSDEDYLRSPFTLFPPAEQKLLFLERLQGKNTYKVLWGRPL